MLCCYSDGGGGITQLESRTFLLVVFFFNYLSQATGWFSCCPRHRQACSPPQTMHEKRASLCRNHQLKPRPRLLISMPMQPPLLVAELGGKWPHTSQKTPWERWGSATLPFSQLKKPICQSSLKQIKGNEGVKHGDCSVHAANKPGSTQEPARSICTVWPHGYCSSLGHLCSTGPADSSPHSASCT